LPTLEVDRYTLDCGEERQRTSPESFELPSESKRQNLARGDCVKLIFRMLNKINEIEVERMWVDVEGKDGNYYIGSLNNEPFSDVDLASEDRVIFEARHVIQIYDEKPK